MKELFFENKYLVNQIDVEVENLQKKFQEIFTDWQQLTTEYLGNPAPLDVETLKSFYDSKGNPVETRIENHILSIKARELKSKYPDFDEDEMKRILNRPIVGMILYSLEAIQPTQYWHCLEFDKKIKVIKPQVEILKDQHRDYAESEAELKRLELAKKVVEGMNAILNEFPHIQANDFHIPQFTFENEGKICISYHWVKFGRLGNSMLPGDQIAIFGKRTKGDAILHPSEPKKIDL